MIETKKIALLVDVDNVKIGGDAFNELYGKLNEIGEVVYCKFYGYNDRKHIYLSEAIAKYGYETAPFMRYKKRFSQLDIRIVVDAIKLNYTKQEIDTYCIVAGDGDLIPLLVELKSSGRTLIDVNTIYQEQNYHMFDAHINLKFLTENVEVYQPKTKKSVLGIKSSKSISKTSISSTSMSKSITEKVPTAPILEKVVPASTMTATSVEEPSSVERTVTQSVTANYNNQVEAEPVVNEDDDKLGDILRDITNRYTELDFSNDSDMDKKVKLIKDIETLIDTETKKGQGLNSSNADVRQIFVELQNIVDDMKNAI